MENRDTEYKDLFSKQAALYSKYRPTYPAALFDYLASLPAQRKYAWDCATGSGQAAIQLAERFSKVIATDASQKQLDQAKPAPNVTYREARAEASAISAGTIDLTTVAQAFHWFDQPKFYEEVRRVSRPEHSWLALWSYSLAEISPEIDERVSYFYSQIVGEYWEPERRQVEDGYQTIDFPFDEVKAPPFKMEQKWNLVQLLGYLNTWSATQACADAEKRDPVKDFANELVSVWGAPATVRPVQWPVAMRVGRVR